AVLELDGTALIDVEVVGEDLEVLTIAFPESAGPSMHVTADGEPLATTGDELLDAGGQSRGTGAVTALAAAPRSLRIRVGPREPAAPAGSPSHSRPYTWRYPVLT